MKFANRSRSFVMAQSNFMTPKFHFHPIFVTAPFTWVLVVKNDEWQNMAITLINPRGIPMDETTNLSTEKETLG